MEISADGSSSIIGVRRTEVLIFNFQGSQKGFLFTLLLYRDWERHFVDPIVNYPSLYSRGKRAFYEQTKRLRRSA